MKNYTFLQLLFTLLAITNIAENNYVGVVVCFVLMYLFTKAKQNQIEEAE